MMRFIAPFVAAAALGACASAPDLNQVHPLTASQGIENDRPLAVVDLEAHNMPGTMADYDLRVRQLVLQPGGGAAEHPHMGRPGVVRVIKGTVVEGRGKDKRLLQVGEYWLETHDTRHWFVNPSKTETAELWIVDIVAKKK